MSGGLAGLDRRAHADDIVKTAALSLINGTDMKLPAPGEKAAEKDEWVVVIGASGSVGQYGVQVRRWRTITEGFATKADPFPLAAWPSLRLQGSSFLLALQELGRCFFFFFFLTAMSAVKLKRPTVLTSSRYLSPRAPPRR